MVVLSVSVTSESTDMVELDADALLCNTKDEDEDLFAIFGGRWDRDVLVETLRESGETEVRHAKESEASEWYGEDRGRVLREMCTPGGKAGERRWMYQPRFGRWIVQ